MKKFAILVTVTLIYLILISQFINIFSADVHYKKSRDLLSEGKIKAALYNTNEAVEKNSREPRYYYQRAKTLLVQNDNEKAEADLKKSIELNPKNLVTIRNIVPIYSFLDSAAALGYYSSIKNVSPNDVGIYVLLAKYEKKLGLEEQYQESIAKITQLRPDLLNWHNSLQ
jgi:tetratricopeptide (TPR) repeat protein